jgi:hypothetical protein
MWESEGEGITGEVRKEKPIPWTETILSKSHKRSSNTSDSWSNWKQRIANCVSTWLTYVQDEESLWILREAASHYETAHPLVSTWLGPGDTRLFLCAKSCGTPNCNCNCYPDGDRQQLPVLQFYGTLSLLVKKTPPGQLENLAQVQESQNLNQRE